MLSGLTSVMKSPGFSILSNHTNNTFAPFEFYTKIIGNIANNVCKNMKTIGKDEYKSQK